MGRIGKYTMIGIIFFVIFLIATIPATFVTNNMLDEKAPIKLYNVSGSAWSGKAGVMQLGDKQLQKFEWDLKALPLIFGTIKFDFSFRIKSSTASGTVALSSFGSGEISIDDTKLNIKSDDVPDFLPIPEPLKLKGPLKVDIEELDISEEMIPVYAQATAQWRKSTAVIGDQNYDLGEFDLNAYSEDDKVYITIKDTKKNGPIEAKLSSEIQENGALLVSGILGTRETADKKLSGFARMLLQGTQQKVVNYKGSIKEPEKIISGVLAGK
ncbi:MAG: type II secretion system protein N [Gammaproteobacteria bacterium]|nr:MAG: type II secretion system protein N [Gammaproteobacteria bacterium]